MKVSKDAEIWIDYHKAHSKKNTVRSYQSVIDRFCQNFGESEIDLLTPDDVLSFLVKTKVVNLVKVTPVFLDTVWLYQTNRNDDSSGIIADALSLCSDSIGHWDFK